MVDLEGIDLFLTKSAHWGYEREWRVLEPLVGAKKVIDRKPFPIYLFEYPASALKEVILGGRVRGETRAAVAECVRQPELRHVVVRQATLDDREFSVRVADVAV